MMHKVIFKCFGRSADKKRVLKSGDISHYGVGCAYHLSLHSRDAVLIKDIHEIVI